MTEYTYTSEDEAIRDVAWRSFMDMMWGWCDHCAGFGWKPTPAGPWLCTVGQGRGHGRYVPPPNFWRTKT
jgi:hypothetical protein